MTKMISSLIENDFVTLLINDVTNFSNAIMDPKNPDRKWAMELLGNSCFINNTNVNPVIDNSSQKKDAKVIYLMELINAPLLNSNDLLKEDDLKTRLNPLVMGLIRVEKLGPALQIYRDKLLKLVKNATKQVILCCKIFNYI